MKFSITKAEYDALSDEQKALYNAKGEGYQVAIEGLPDFAAMESKLTTLLDEKKKGKEAQTAAEKAAQEKADEAARLAGDVATLEKSWQAKLDKMTETHTSELGRYKGQVQSLMIGDVAKTVAGKLFGKNAAIMLPHVTKRLALESAEDGSFKTRILDEKGQPSAASLDDLEKEFSGNADYASVLVTTQAAGPSGAAKAAHAETVKPTDNGKLDNRAIALEAVRNMPNQ